MNLKTKKISIIERDFPDNKGQEIEANVIEHISFDLIGYPEFTTENVCLCSRKDCKELQVDLKVTLDVNRSEYFKLLGLMAHQDAVSACMEGAPIKLSLDVDIKKLQEAFKKESIIEEKMVKKVDEIEKLNELFNFAIKKHSGQFRITNNGEKIDYITHPHGVLLNVFKYFNESKVKANLDDLTSAALAHDLLEDTDTTENELKPLMSKRALEIVNVLANTKQKYPNCNKDERSKRYVADIKKFGDEAIFVKICDSIHNLNSCVNAPQYLIESTVHKAKEFYLPLLRGSKISDKIKAFYIQKIAKINNLLLERNLNGNC